MKTCQPARVRSSSGCADCAGAAGGSGAGRRAGHRPRVHLSAANRAGLRSRTGTVGTVARVRLHGRSIRGSVTDLGAACPSWLLAAYDATGKHELVGGGRGAPVTLRAWIAPMLHLGVEDRLCGGVVILRPTWAELVSWIWARPPKLRDPDRWRSYMAQISAVSAVRIPVVIDGLPYWRAPVLVVGDLPGRYPGPSWAAEHRVTLRIQMPPAAAHGPRLSFPTLREYGSRSAALYRAYLTATAVMDHAARKGQPVTAKHPERARQRVPDWNADKLARIIGLSPHRENRRRALEAWQQLAADGVIELVETAPGRWGIYSPQQAQQAADIR